MIESEIIEEQSSKDNTKTLIKSVSSKKHLKQKSNFSANYRNNKIDDNKLLEVNRKRVALFQYLSKLNKEKKVIKEKNSLLETHLRSTMKKNTMKQNDEAMKKKETRRAKKLLQMKKKKKEEKKRQKNKKNNFMTGNHYLKQIVYDDYDVNHLKEIKNWLYFLKDKMRRIFPPSALNIDYLIKQLEMFINANQSKSMDMSINELSKIRNFKGVEVRTQHNKHNAIDGAEDKDDLMDSEQKVKLAEEQKRLLEALIQKETQFLKNKDEVKTFLSNMKGYENALKEKNVYLMEKYLTALAPTPTPDGEPKAKEEKSTPRDALDIEEADRLKERVINYTLKTFDKFCLKRIVEYWIDNCDKLQEKKTKELHYRYRSNDVKEENDERDRKKQQKALNVKHIYSTPSNEVLQIIPFCSKKYTIQKK